MKEQTLGHTLLDENDTKIDQSHIEIEFRHPKMNVYLIITHPDVKMWLDTKGIPGSAFLCACHDCIPMMKCNVGEEGKEVERSFLPMEWVINEWGGPEDLIEVIKNLRDKTIKDLPGLREKYWGENE